MSRHYGLPGENKALMPTVMNNAQLERAATTEMRRGCRPQLARAKYNFSPGRRELTRVATAQIACPLDQTLT